MGIYQRQCRIGGYIFAIKRLYTLSFSALPGVNFTAFDAGIWISLKSLQFPRVRLDCMRSLIMKSECAGAMKAMEGNDGMVNRPARAGIDRSGPILATHT